jgi:hypothetical protein
MTSFWTYFPDVAAMETRTVTFRGRRTIPDGEYRLVELYCERLDCDCEIVKAILEDEDYFCQLSVE